MTPHKAKKHLNKSELCVRYLISVWDEVQGNWREKPDHVQQKFLDAEEEIKDKLKNLDQ